MIGKPRPWPPSAGRPVTTGSKATAPVSFRLSADQRKRAEKMARKRGMTVGQFAKWALGLVCP